MAHQSDNTRRLRLQEHHDVRSTRELVAFADPRPCVYLLVFPFGRTLADDDKSHSAWKAIQALTQSIHSESTVAILTTPPDAASLWLDLESYLKFQLWVAVKLHKPIELSGHLPQQHAALLILTKYRGSLQHCKTRIAYTYCPACEKTTKDYGGKKHTYHEYGTLMSDVWRDVPYDPEGDHAQISSRLQDVFAVDPYKTLHVLDLRRARELRPRNAPPARAPKPAQATST